MGMRRFVALIVLIFAFASLAGMTTAHAHRYISTPIVVLNHVDANNQSIPVIVAVQRGEIDLGSGIMLPCGPHHAIPVTITAMPSCPAQASLTPVLDRQLPDWIAPGLRRPPRQA